MLEALPAELREQVEQSWSHRDGRPNNCHSPSPQPSALLPQPSSVKSCPTSPFRPPTPVGTLVLQIPNQPDSPGIVLELPNFSQVRMQWVEIRFIISCNDVYVLQTVVTVTFLPFVVILPNNSNNIIYIFVLVTIQ